MRHLSFSRVSLASGPLAFMAVLSATTALSGQAHAQYTARVAPITNTATHAFNSSYYQNAPLNLAALTPYAYSETEYTLSGLANVYQYSNPSSTTDDSYGLEQTSPVAYVNRILVRAPSNRANFSGNVIVEIANDALISDNQTAWPFANTYFTSNGDAYILLTSTPAGLATLKAYSATRYRGLSWPVAASTRGCSGGVAGEGGIIYDQITELGNLLKSNASGSPLAGYSVKHLLITGYSGAASILLTYDRVFGLHSSLYDGYFVASGGFRAALNGCEASSTSINRTEPPASTVSAVFQSQSISELVAAEAQTLAGTPTTIPTSADSNTPTNRYRLYEIAGSSHVNGDLFRFSPQQADYPAPGPALYLTDATESSVKSECGEPSGSVISAFPNRYVYDALWSNLEKWATQGTSFTPPSETSAYSPAAYLTSLAVGQPPAQVGGVRSPAVDHPIDSYYSGTALSGGNSALTTFCVLTGYQVPNGGTVNAGNVATDAALLNSEGFMTAADAAQLENSRNAPLAYTFPDGTTTVP